MYVCFKRKIIDQCKHVWLIPRLNTHAQLWLDLHMLPNLILIWTSHVDRSPHVWGQPMLKNYTCLRGLHHLPSEEMYVLKWKRRNSKKMQPTLHGQVPAERRLKRECFLSSVRPADFPAKVTRCSEWQHWQNLGSLTALSTWMKV